MNVSRILIGRDRIAARVAEMGQAITRDLQAVSQAPVVMVPILTGAMVFVADLIRHMPVQMSIRPVTLSSYHGASTVSAGSVTIRGELPTDLQGSHVVVVDDILDTGRTLGLLRRMIQAQHPASVRLAVLLTKRKPMGRDEDVSVEYSGFDIDDEFVVGYGLDYDGYFRNLPEVGVLSL